MTETNILTVTNEGLKKLTDELEYLKTEKRKEVVENIRVALSFGDLSENSEYEEAKNEQAKVEGRIVELENMLKKVKVISEHEVKTDIVNVGAKIKVFDIDRKVEREYTLVGSTEADPLSGKISDLSPIGKAVIGSKVGDILAIAVPSGEIHIEIKEISK